MPIILGIEGEHLENVLKDVPDIPIELRPTKWTKRGEPKMENKYIVAITIKSEILLCSGVLISDDLVLTAEDCLPTVSYSKL